MDGSPTLTAFRTGPAPAVEIVPAERGRAWMDATHNAFAKRCLPVLIANAAGWFLLNPIPFSVRWDGKQDIDALTFRYAAGEAPFVAESHFGHGIVTFRVPFVFRTSPGWLLVARGPANLPKRGASPLEGIVETDWAVQSFTMNWQITEPGRSVRFGAGEPFCQLFPIRRGDLESFDPVIRPIQDDPELHAHYNAYTTSRLQFNADLKRPGSKAVAAGWQRDYMRGTSPSGASAGEGQHQTSLKLRPFRHVADKSG